MATKTKLIKIKPANKNKKRVGRLVKTTPKEVKSKTKMTRGKANRK